MSGTTTISGMKELNSLLNQLPVNIERNVMRQAIKRGQDVLADAARGKLQADGSVDSGELLKSVRVTFKRRSERFGWIRSYLVAGNKIAYYAHMLEFGTASYYTGTGTTVGKPYAITPKVAGSLFLGGVLRQSATHPGVRPRPFMRYAVDNYSDAAIDTVANYLRDRIPREIRKVGL